MKTNVLRRLFLSIPLFFVTCFAFGQQAIHLRGATALGDTAPSQKLTVTLNQPGTVDQVKVFSHGVEDFDFRATADTCKASTFSSGQTCSVDVAFTPKSPGERTGVVLLLDMNQHPLAAQPFAALATGPIATFIPGEITTVAGNGGILYNRDGVAATAATLFIPFGVTIDGSGNLYIADTFNNRIRKVTATTGIISTIAGNGSAGFSGDGGAATAATLNNPSSVQLDSVGNVYIADTGNNRIRVLNVTTGVISTVAGDGTAAFSGDGGLGTAASLNGPNGLDFDGVGNLYIADTINNRVRVLNTTTGIISTFAGTGTAAFSGDGGAATAAGLNQPWGVTFAAAGNVYIADKKNNRVRVVSPTGTISSIAGGATAEAGNGTANGDGAVSTAALLNAPSSTAVDAAGNVYIADTGANRIRKINPATKIIQTIAGGGSFGNGSPATGVSLSGPYAITLDIKGNLFIADAANNRIRKDASDTAILPYPTMRVNSVSAPLSQIIENDGIGDLNISSVANVLYGQVDPTTTCGTAALAPLAQCTITAEFVPGSVTGTPVSGSISVTSNAQNNPGTLNLSAYVQSTFPSTVSITSFPNPSIVGNAVQFSVQVVNSGGVVPTGTVTLIDTAADGTTTTVGALTLDPTTGAAAVAISTLAVGTHSITASYAGDTNYSSSVSTVDSQVVTAVPANSATNTTLTSSANPATLGEIVNFNATVAAATAGQPVPQGTVTFTEGTTVLGTGTLSAAGLASIGISTLTQGTHNIVATYGGSGLYVASASQPYPEVVGIGGSGSTNQFTITANPSAISLTAGTHTTVQVTVNPTANFADTVSFGCSGLPAYATCTFTKPQITIATGTPQTVSVVVDTANPLSSGGSAQLREPGSPESGSPGSSAVLAFLPAGALLAFFIGRKRRGIVGLLLYIVGLGAITAFSGCSSSFTGKSTAAGAYTFQVFAAGSNTGATFAVPVQLTVTK